MRLVKSVQYAIGFAVSSGVAVVLGGYAFASDASQSTTPQTTSVQAVTKQVQSETPAVVTPTTDTSSTGSSGGQSTTSGDVSVQTATSSSTAGNTSQGSGGDTSSHASTSSPSAVEAKSDNGAGASSDVAHQQTTNNQSASGTTGGPDNGTKVVSEDAASAEPSSIQSDIHQVVVLTTTDVAAPASQAVAMTRATVLPIQPTITSHTAITEDLAASVPSAAPTSATPKSPMPAKSSGALGRLTAILAATIVPQPLLATAIVPHRLSTLLSFIILLTVASMAVIATYGQWLRRGGFATAPRSDAGMGHISFATPLLLGYAAVLPHQHSPIFSGGRYETFKGQVPNAYRKEEIA